MASPVHILSLGAGVQSTTMALMAAYGEITPMPDCAIFADTGWEPRRVYGHLNWLETLLPFPIHRVSGGNLRQEIIDHAAPQFPKLSTRKRLAAVPWFMADGGMGMRQCTHEYKLRPIQRKVVALLGGRPKGGCTMWVGISTDEAIRMKPSRVQYIVNRWPLIEKGLSRQDCLRWMERHGYPTPPKSSCIGCPFHSDAMWRELKKNPEEWADAVEVDAAIRNQPKMRRQQFMHRSLVPLNEVDLSTPEDHGQLNMFNNECEGMCGV